MNVIVVVCYSLHLGFLGAYGNAWIETPNLDRLASEGMAFGVDSFFCSAMGSMVHLPGFSTTPLTLGKGRYPTIDDVPLSAACRPGRNGEKCLQSSIEFRPMARGLTMIDEMTKDSLRVSTDGIAGPYLMVPVTQLDAVLAVLDRHKVRYWVDADAISLDNEPAITVINFDRSGDAAWIQAILDEAG
jgi:hypothetical protein